MAAPITAKFGQFFVRLSDGGSPASFIAPCGFTSKSFTRNKTLNEVQIPDCDDPDAPAWSARDVASMSATISGSGVLAKSAVVVWEDALASNDSVEAEVELVYTDGAKEIYVGNFHLENFEVTGAIGDRVNASVTMQSDGEVTHTAAAAPLP